MKAADVMPALLQACPGFEPAWRALSADGSGDLLYVAFGESARYLHSKKKEGKEEELHAAAGFIERMHCEGDDYVRELATIGALEGIQNVWSHTDEGADAFAPYLRSESKRWWYSLDRFWSGEIPHVGADIKQG